ncbi:MAG: succinate CoA transferase [Candidatus Accumulibacter sp.]|jgi:acetyl-CoA hydrolase|nr:succinate CoA transferase [Accumulibacter sp.]
MSLPFPILTADEAADLIQNGQTIGVGGFTAAASPKAVTPALANKAKREHEAGRPFKVGVMSGASTGKSCDGALAEAEAISFRTPYQGNPTLRKLFNEGKVNYFDMHLSLTPQAARYGFFGKMNWAIVEACDITTGGGIVLTSAVGNAYTYLKLAEKVIIELNAAQSKNLLGMHDIYEPRDPPFRREIPIFSVSDRIGSPICVVDPAKIAGIVLTDKPDEVAPFEPPTPETDQIGQNVADFFAADIKAGRIPASFLPLQSGVGNIANAVIGALGRSPDIPAFEMYTEVLQDSVLALVENGRCTFGSTCSLTVSQDMMKKLVADIGFYKKHLLLRPQEISNNPEVARRLGIISMNTAIEFDLAGSVNSTHIMGKTMMNGIGGSGDFTRAAYISVFSCPSVAKGGKISAVVPVAAHQDHSEHSVQVLVTEQGVADLRGKDAMQRAKIIIDNCVHPDYKELMRDYLKYVKTPTHQPFDAAKAFAFHREFADSGDMRNTDWGKYL